MKLTKTFALFCALAALAACGGGATAVDGDVPEPPDVDVPDPAAPAFEADVLPIFQAQCTSCHGQAAGLDLAGYDTLMAGAEGEQVVVPGDPDGSELIEYVDGTKEKRMPLNADPLTDEQIATLRDWIAAGAKND